MSSAMKNGGEEISEVRRGPWTVEEDKQLIGCIALHGEGQWNILAKQSGLKRTGKSCRLRWLNYLKPDVKRGNLTVEEQLLILQLHSKWGNRWSKIAQQLPGRTDNEIKNYWRTRVQKQARELKLECTSKKFFDAVRYLYMPSSSSSSSSSSSAYNQNFFNSSEAPSNLHSNPSLSILQPSSSSSDRLEIQGFAQSSGAGRWPEVPELPEYHSAEFGNFLHRNQIMNDGFQFDPFSAMGTWEVAGFDGQMAAGDWLTEGDVVDNLWNLDV